MSLITLPLVNPRHHIGELKGFAHLLFEAFMRAYFDSYMKLLYPLCLVRWCKYRREQCYTGIYGHISKTYVRVSGVVGHT